MSFTGDLKDISIVDVIQLLQTTRKSGTLSINGKRGKSSVVFRDGNIIGANHVGNDDYISEVMLDMGSVTPEVIEKITSTKDGSGPLIASLIEHGVIDESALSSALRKLIELTVVELVGWRRGTFTLDTEALSPPEPYNCFSEKTGRQINVDTQMILMDALRIFDEQQRDRSPEEEARLLLEEEQWAEETGTQGGFSNLTAEDLGLSDIDKLQVETPEQFSGVETFDLSAIHRQMASETLSDFPDEEQEKFVSFLNEFSANSGRNNDIVIQEGKGLAVILFSRDELLKYSVVTMFKHEPVFVFTADTQDDLDQKIDQCILQDTLPILVFDRPDKSGEVFSEESIAGLQSRARERHPDISIIQFFCSNNSHNKTFDKGVIKIIPAPLRKSHHFIEESIEFLNSFHSIIKGMFNNKKKQPSPSSSPDNGQTGKLRNFIVTLRHSRDNKDVSSALLRFVSEIFERTVLFFVRETFLTGDKSTGIKTVDKDEGGPVKLNIPLTKPSIFSRALESGTPFFDEIDDTVVKKYIFDKIGSPLRKKIFLLPITAHGKTVAILYGDFAQKELIPVQLDSMEILSNQAGIILENISYRKHFNKMAKAGSP